MVEKIDPTDGAVFRQLRLNHHQTLAQVADDQNSIAFISKFEQGKSNISFSRLSHLLFRINMSVEEFLFIRDLQAGIVPPLKDSEFTYNTLIHRDFEAVLAFQDRFSSEEPTLADYRYLLKQEKIWQQRYAQDHNRQTQFEFITIRIFRLTMIDRVKPPEQPSPFTNVEDAMAQLQALAKPVVSYLYTVEVWNYFELYWFRHLMVALPSKTIHNLLPLAIKRSEKYRAFNQIGTLRVKTLFSAFTVFINARQLPDAKKALTTTENACVNCAKSLKGTTAASCRAIKRNNNDQAAVFNNNVFACICSRARIENRSGARLCRVRCKSSR
ncbi:Rgg/GadR/MutR family transcriptional regulator [Lacticaseibacillus rhamnosus]|uniref:Rgg/GadR/MutR family transcriptional regulator n=1 Tax=Lacticaseibacillus rhamnosus TaxID=47715 RepID=UPI002916736A|nr:Rgg/GadR/MutR family transcriptional regulator [Lacticaseibacillus rhamnosus]WNX08642.1 Rgg/GadR/MutR family transcriptional regulator [Lacticaseibacillus rhamnosus]